MSSWMKRRASSYFSFFFSRSPSGLGRYWGSTSWEPVNTALRMLTPIAGGGYESVCGDGGADMVV